MIGVDLGNASLPDAEQLVCSGCKRRDGQREYEGLRCGWRLSDTEWCDGKLLPPTPEQSARNAMLALDDGTLAAAIVGAMSVGARPENFAALGRIIRAGVQAGGDLELALRRRGR